jgi:hypothetical protein
MAMKRILLALAFPALIAATPPWSDNPATIPGIQY